MKAKEFAVLGKEILPLLPGFTVRGSLVFAAPIGHTLRAIHFGADRSKWEWFQVHAFILPLYVPREFIGFSFGRRLERPFKIWDINEPDTIDVLKSIVAAEALPILVELETPLEAAAAVARWGRVEDIHAQEAIAYSLILAGDTHAAVQWLDRMIEDTTSGPQWVIDLGKRAEIIKTKLLADPNEAAAQLGEWRKESLRNLKLEKYAEEVYVPR